MSSTKESSFFYVEYLHTCCPRDWVRIKNFENLAYGQVNFTTGYYSKYQSLAHIEEDLCNIIATIADIEFLKEGAMHCPVKFSIAQGSCSKISFIFG